MSTIRIGFCGVGWMGEQFIKALLRRTDSELTAVYDIAPQNAGEVLERNRIAPHLLVSRFEHIIADPDIDAVMIASVNTAHAGQSLATLSSGKHVFCEKPNATTWKDHLDLVNADSEQSALITVTNYTLYFNPMEQQIKRMIDRGVFGDILQIQVNYRHAVNISGGKAWKLKKQFLGDALGMGITHAVFLICYFLAPAKPISVYAGSHHRKATQFEVDTNWSLLIRFDNGAHAVVLGDIENGNSYDVYQNLFGTRGGLVFESQPNDKPQLKYWSADTGGKWRFPLQERDDPWLDSVALPTSGDVVHHSTAESLDHFLDHIHRGEKSVLGFESMRAVQDINFAAQLSAAQNVPVEIPADPAHLKTFLG